MTNSSLRNLKNIDDTQRIQKIQTEVDNICKIIIHSAKYKSLQYCKIPVNDRQLYDNEDIICKIKEKFPECIVFLKDMELMIDWSK